MSSSAALTTLSRLALRKPEAREWLARALDGRLEDFAEVALDVTMETGGPIGPVLAVLICERASPELAERLMHHCNEREAQESVYVLEVAEAATRKHLLHLQGSLPVIPDREQLLELARTQSNLGNRLSRLQQWAKALPHHREGAQIRKSLLSSGEDVLSELVISLTNLAHTHGSLGDWGEALVVAQDAMQLLQGSTDKEVELSIVAMSHRTLAIILSELGRPQEALAASFEALELYRDLAKKNSLRFLPEVARDLVNSSGRLRELGRMDEALDLAREALSIRESLAAERPESFLPYLALTHQNLGVLLHELGREEEALSETQKGVNLRRQLAADRPDTFMVDLASSLYNLGSRLSDLNRLEEALIVADEVIDCYRKLIPRSPLRFVPDLADRLAHRCELLRGLGRMEGLFNAAEEGLRELIPYLADYREAVNRHLAALFGHYLNASAATGRTRDLEIARGLQRR